VTGQERCEEHQRRIETASGEQCPSRVPAIHPQPLKTDGRQVGQQTEQAVRVDGGQPALQGGLRVHDRDNAQRIDRERGRPRAAQCANQA